EVHFVGLQHADRDTGCDSGIDRVPAGFEDLEPGVCGEIMSCGDHMPRSHDAHAGGGHSVSCMLGLKSVRDQILAPFNFRVIFMPLRTRSGPVVAGLSSVALTFLAGSIALAQPTSWVPTKPVEFVVGVSPGARAGPSARSP